MNVPLLDDLEENYPKKFKYTLDGEGYSLIAFNHNGSLAATGTDDGRVKIYDWWSRSLLLELPRIESELNLYAATEEHSIDKANFNSKAKKTTLQDNKRVTCLIWKDSSKYLIIGRADGLVYAYSIDSLTLLFHKKFASSIYYISLCPYNLPWLNNQECRRSTDDKRENHRNPASLRTGSSSSSKASKLYYLLIGTSFNKIENDIPLTSNTLYYLDIALMTVDGNPNLNEKRKTITATTKQPSKTKHEVIDIVSVWRIDYMDRRPKDVFKKTYSSSYETSDLSVEETEGDRLEFNHHSAISINRNTFDSFNSTSKLLKHNRKPHSHLYHERPYVFKISIESASSNSTYSSSVGKSRYRHPPVFAFDRTKCLLYVVVGLANSKQQQNVWILVTYLKDFSIVQRIPISKSKRVQVNSIQINERCETILVCSTDAVIRLYSTRTFSLINKFQNGIDRTSLDNAIISPNGLYIAATYKVVTNPTEICVWKCNSPEILIRMQGHPTINNRLLFWHPTRAMIVACSKKGTLDVFGSVYRANARKCYVNERFDRSENYFYIEKEDELDKCVEYDWGSIKDDVEFETIHVNVDDDCEIDRKRINRLKADGDIISKYSFPPYAADWNRNEYVIESNVNNVSITNNDECQSDSDLDEGNSPSKKKDNNMYANGIKHFHKRSWLNETQLCLLTVAGRRKIQKWALQQNKKT